VVPQGDQQFEGAEPVSAAPDVRCSFLYHLIRRFRGHYKKLTLFCVAKS
jgi:hypothetical protein